MSVAKATYPVSGFQSQEPSSAVGGRPRAWGFWASLGWFGVAVVAAFMVLFLCGFMLLSAPSTNPRRNISW